MIKAEQVRRWALEQVGAPYIYGGIGRKCTPKYREQQIKQYPRYEDAIRKYCPVLSGAQEVCSGCKYNGRMAFDCAQLTRRAAEAAGLTLPSGANSQLIKGDWLLTGPIDTLPLNRVAFLYRRDAAGKAQHTGIYLGDGTVVDARGHASGVVRNKLREYGWTDWRILNGQDAIYTGDPLPVPAAPPKVDVVAPTASTKPAPERILAVSKGQPLQRGEDVRTLQHQLVSLGYTVGEKGADGVYGYDTEAAVRAWQVASNRSVTGILDEVERSALMASRVKPATVELYTVTIPGLTKAQADAIKTAWSNATVTNQR